MNEATQRSRRLAQNLVEVLAPYEEELIVLEHDAPGLTSLRRAIGMTIAEASYCIFDQGAAPPNWVPPADDETGRTR